MSEAGKEKIRQGVKAYHKCAKDCGCGKDKKKPMKKEPKKKPKPEKVLTPLKPQAKAKKEKKEQKKAQPKKVSTPILAIEDIKKQTAPKKVKKNYSVDQQKRKEANAETKRLYKKSVHQILGLKPYASPEEIKAKFRTFLKFHPDKTGKEEPFQMYNLAYQNMLNSIDIKN